MRRIALYALPGLMLPAGPARAEGADALQPYTWDSLATVGGAASATLLIVQFLKAPLDRWHHIPTRVLALVIAFALLTGARAFTAGLAWRDVPLIAVNAVLVALTAMGTYEVSFAKVDRSAETKPAASPKKGGKRP
jgi:hypothetical protein